MDSKSDKSAKPDFRKAYKKKEATPKISKLVVKEDCELMEFLLDEFPSRSRNKIKSWLRNKNVEVNKQIETNGTHKLLAGDELCIFWGRVYDRKDLKGINILYEDSYLMVIYKPVGLLSITPDDADFESAYSILTDYLKTKDRSGKVYVVHRLDGKVSGVMMFAKDPEIQKKLKDNWKEIVFERKYIAVTSGILQRTEGTVESYLIENKALKVFSTQDSEKGQLAITHYKTLKRRKPYSLMEIVLDTGRKNQIRVHMSDLGQPIVGDAKYDSEENPFKRIGLHAWILGFTHPVTNEVMQFESKIPPEFLKIFENRKSLKLNK